MKIRNHIRIAQTAVLLAGAAVAAGMGRRAQKEKDKAELLAALETYRRVCEENGDQEA